MADIGGAGNHRKSYLACQQPGLSNPPGLDASRLGSALDEARVTLQVPDRPVDEDAPPVELLEFAFSPTEAV
jgi:hypothetical protein